MSCHASRVGLCAISLGNVYPDPNRVFPGGCVGGLGNNKVDEMRTFWHKNLAKRRAMDPCHITAAIAVSVPNPSSQMVQLCRFVVVTT